jgi:hypothetical protein
MDFIRNLAIEQRKRLVGSLMDYAEKQLYPYLPADVRRGFREKVMQSVGQYHDFVLDSLKASISDTSVVNEAAIELLQQIHTQVHHLSQDVKRGNAGS